LLNQETHRRRDFGILQTTERDILTLTWIAEQYCISYDHLQRLLAFHTPATTKNPERVAPSTAYNAIERWLKLGYIETPQKVIREHTTYLWVSRKGMKELDLPYAYYTPKASTIRHIYAVNAIRLHMQSYHLSAQWIAQRAIRLQTERRPLPDAHMELQSVPLTALQVTEQQRLATITLQEEIVTLQALTQRYTRIWYFVHASIVKPLQTALYEHDAKALTDDQIANHIIWYTLDAKEINEQQREKPA
jgi:hypothetical protein